MEFHIGDTVVLKSGGPRMYVRAVCDCGKVICEWLEDDTSMRVAVFVPATLDKYVQMLFQR